MKAHFPIEDPQSVSSVLGRIVEDANELLRSELRLLRNHLDQRLVELSKKAATLGALAALFLVGTGLAILGATDLLVTVGVAPWLARVLVGVACLSTGGFIMYRQIDEE